MVSGMRPSMFSLIVVTAVSMGLVVGADAQTRPAAKRPPAKAASKAPEPPPPPPDPANQMKTSDQMKRESVEGAVTAPLRDLNVVKTDIPEVLMAALADPYARPPARATCRQLIAMILPIDEALGPDIDKFSTDDPNMRERGKSTALGLGADLASGAIPFRGVVRRVTGAAAHDRLVQDAIVAGSVRRAYLKGLGEARGCGPPATPSHERTPTAAAAPAPPPKSGLKPQYPTRAPPTAAPKKPAGKSQAAPR